MKSRTYNIDTVGDIKICKHHNTKRLSIKLKPNAIPKVIIPSLMTYESGYRFALEKKRWIIEHSKKLNEITPNSIYNENNGLTTRFHNIEIKPGLNNKVEVKKFNNTISIYYPMQVSVESENIQNTIKNAITEILRFEAKKHLIPRTHELALKCGFNVNKVFVKNLKSRWGSCSVQNNINLNIHLMRMPEHLSDFIILHELCHTVHKNHGPHFHSLLNKLVGDEKALNKQLKKYKTQL